MNINILRKFNSYSTLFGFFSLFSFFLYSYKYLNISGYILISTFLFFIVFFVEKLKNKKVKLINKNDIFVFIFFLYCFSWLSLNFIFYNNVYEFYIYSLQSLIFMIVMYLLGRGFEINTQFKNIFIILFVLNFIFFISNFDPNVSSIMILNEENEIDVTYQSIARCYLVIGAFLTLLLDRNTSKALVGLATIIILFLVGSRSDFMAYMIFFMLYILFFFKNRYIIVVFIAVVTALYSSLITNLDFSQYRVFSIFDGFSGSSWDSRKIYESYTLEIIKNSPVFGGTYEQYLKTGTVGGYSHNILSVWQAYGLLGFILLILLLLIPIILSVSKLFLRKNKLTEYDRFTICFGLSCIILLITSKPHYWSIFFLYIGMFTKGLLNESMSLNISSPKK